MNTRILRDGRSIVVHDNGGLRKRCRCPRRQWIKCPHSWSFNSPWVSHRLWR